MRERDEHLGKTPHPYLFKQCGNNEFRYVSRECRFSILYNVIIFPPARAKSVKVIEGMS